MGDGRRRLQQDQALVGIERVGPPGEGVAREGQEILLRVLPAQRELESRLAIFVAMARPRIATGFAQHRHHVIAEGDGASLVSTGTRRALEQDDAERAKNSANHKKLHDQPNSTWSSPTRGNAFPNSLTTGRGSR